jgi:hypothetical protein
MAVLGVEEEPLTGEPTVDDVEHDDVAPRDPVRLHHVQQRLVGGEREPVGRAQVRGGGGQLAGGAVDAVQGGGELGGGSVALVVARDPERGIREPHRPVPGHDHVVGRVQALALPRVRQHADAAVILRAGDASAAVLAGDQPAGGVPGVPVREVRRVAPDAGLAGLLVPPHQPVVRDVAPDQAARVPEPHRTLGPPAPGGEPLDLRLHDDVLLEPAVEHVDGGVRYPVGRLPAGHEHVPARVRRARAGPPTRPGGRCPLPLRLPPLGTGRRCVRMRRP